MSLTHFDAQGQAHMVDVSGKADTAREAVAADEPARGEVAVGWQSVQAFLAERAALGPVLLEVRGALQRILDLGARREDGLARLAAAAGASTVASAGAGQGEAGE